MQSEVHFREVSLNEFNPRIVAFGMLGALLFCFIGWADFRSGSRLDFSILYFLPVALWAWYLGIGPAVVMAVASAFGAFAKTLNLLSLHGHPHGHLFGAYQEFNGATRLAVFLAVAWGASLLHQRFIEEARLAVRLGDALAALEKSAPVREVLRLREEAVTVCPITRKILIGGEWIDLRRFLATRLGLSVVETLSDEALSRIADKVAEYHEAREGLG